MSRFCSRLLLSKMVSGQSDVQMRSETSDSQEKSLLCPLFRHPHVDVLSLSGLACCWMFTLEVGKGSLAGSGLRNEDAGRTLGFKMNLALKPSGFDFPPQMTGIEEREKKGGTVIHISRPEAPQRDFGIKRYEPLN